MANNAKRKGSRYERKAIGLLQKEGYVCIRAGSSLGEFDIWAVGTAGVRLIQVKSGTARLRKEEREAIGKVPVPCQHVTKEYWHFKEWARQPKIEILK